MKTISIQYKSKLKIIKMKIMDSELFGYGCANGDTKIGIRSKRNYKTEKFRKGPAKSKAT